MNPKTQQVAIVPVTVTDRTCLQVLGCEWRCLRPWLEERGIPIGRIGRRPVVRVDVVLAALSGEPVATKLWSEADVIAAASRDRGGK